MLKPKVCRLRTSNLVSGWSMRCEVWLLHVGGDNGACRVAQLVRIRIHNFNTVERWKQGLWCFAVGRVY